LGCSFREFSPPPRRVQAGQQPFTAKRLLEYMCGRRYRDAFEVILERIRALSDQLISERNQHYRGWRPRK